MPLVTLKVIEGVFTREQKQAMIGRVTEAMAEIEGENLRPGHLGPRRGGAQR